MTFEISDGTLRSRIDRTYVYDDYWISAHPDLQPQINFTLVVDATQNGSACFTQGQNSFYVEDPTEALGCADPFLADYLINQARQFALPWLLSKLITDIGVVQLSEGDDAVAQNSYLELFHQELGLSILVYSSSDLPYAIRSKEKNVVFGDSASDLVFSDWELVSTSTATSTQVTSVRLPHRLQTVYNSVSVLEDIAVESIILNEVLQEDFFESGSATTVLRQSQRLATSSEYPRSEVLEFFEAGLWDGPFEGNVSQVVVGYPIPGMEQIMTIYIGYPDYVQVMVEFENGLLITDAAPHRSKIILEWVEANKGGKKITHVVPSHHHRDHVGSVADYLAAGATLGIPEVAKDLYNFTGTVSSMATYSEDSPFVMKDKTVEFRSFWKKGNPHAEDWSFGVATRVDSSNSGDAVVCSLQM